LEPFGLDDIPSPTAFGLICSLGSDLAHVRGLYEVPTLLPGVAHEVSEAGGNVGEIHERVEHAGVIANGSRVLELLELLIHELDAEVEELLVHRPRPGCGIDGVVQAELLVEDAHVIVLTHGSSLLAGKT
jgi:hypothetical protein